MRTVRRLCFILVAVLTLSMTGCLGLVANLIHAGWGNLIPAAFDELAGRKIAVVCLSSSMSFGNSSAAEEISHRVEQKLAARVPEINIIDQQEIADWMDRNDWNEVDYRELGDGIGTDFLIAVDLGNFSLHEGPTLYKGRAEIGITVYNIPQGIVVYQVEPREIIYPVNGGEHTADTSESAFRKIFLEVISAQVARHFYSYEMKEDFGRDASMMNM